MAHVAEPHDKYCTGCQILALMHERDTAERRATSAIAVAEEAIKLAGGFTDEAREAARGLRDRLKRELADGMYQSAEGSAT